MNEENVYALVLGGYINGYSSIRELYSEGIRNIGLIDYAPSLASKSNKVKWYLTVEKSPKTLKEGILKLHKIAEYIVLFPTDDLQLEFLHSIYDDIKDFCFIPINRKNIIQSTDKLTQYKACEKVGIPHPKTVKVSNDYEISNITSLMFPVIIKPNKRKDKTTKVFRSLYITDAKDLEIKKDEISRFFQEGIIFLASEFIPGDDTNIYSYSAYRNSKGEIYAEWIGKKLNQYPNLFGIFSSATNKCPEIVRKQGRKLIEEMNLIGISQPEFKYDYRDKKYKLMEINLRSTMWHRLAYLSGIKCIYSQYLDALGKNIPKQKQNLTSNIHYLYMKHEWINLISRKGYLKYFMFNRFGGGKKFFAVFDIKDIKPYLFDLKITLESILVACLKRLGIK